jgi:hypothetical protein
MDRRVLPIGLLLLLVATSIVQLPPSAQAAYVSEAGFPCETGSACPHLIEGFENVTFPNPPISPYYTFTSVAGTGASGGFSIASENVPTGAPAPESGDQTLRVQLASGTGGHSYSVRFNLGTNLCEGNGPGGTRTVDVSFWFAAGALTTSIGLYDTVAGSSAAVNAYQSTGGADSATFTGASSANLGTDFFVSNAWNRIGISCSDSAATFAYYNYGTSSTLTRTAAAFNPTELRITNTANTGAGSVYIDRINFGAPPAITQTSAEGPSLTVEALAGFDVDRTGTTLIARTGGAPDNEQYVRTYQAGTLATPGNSVDTDCNRIGGVAALVGYTAFFDCDETTPGQVDHLKIRSDSLGDADIPAFCLEGGGSFCVQDIDANELAGCQGPNDDSPDSCTGSSFQYDIVGLTEVPFDYSAGCDAGGTSFFTGTNSALHGQECGSRDAIYMAFGATFENGYVGVITYTMNRNGDDKSQITRVQLGPSGTVINQMCVVQDPDGKSYLYAAQSSADVRGWRLDFSIVPGGAFPAPGSSLTVNMVPVFTGTAQTTNPVGVACGNGKFATLQANGNLCVFARGGASPLFPCRSVSSAHSGSLAMAGNSNYVSWVEGTSVRTMCAIAAGCPATTHRAAAAAGALVAQSTIPSETVVATKLDGHGNSLWVATTVKIRLYNSLYQLTSGNATACLPGDVGCGQGGPNIGNPTGGAGDIGDLDPASLFAPYVAGLGLILGSQVGGQLATTALLMFLVAAVFGARWGLPGGIFGAVIGFAIALVGLVFPADWGLATTLLICAGAVLALVIGGRR